MSIVPINREVWVGSFWYEFENGYGELEEVEVSWTLTIDVKDGSFSGTRIDEETKDLFDNPVKVNGFKEDDEISFVVYYPYNYYSDEASGDLIAQPDVPHPGAKYHGTWNSEEKKYEGRWTVDLYEEAIGAFQNYTLVNSIEGDWEMKRLTNLNKT